jgi:hypothetical protein
MNPNTEHLDLFVLLLAYNSTEERSRDETISGQTGAGDEKMSHPPPFSHGWRNEC